MALKAELEQLINTDYLIKNILPETLYNLFTME